MKRLGIALFIECKPNAEHFLAQSGGREGQRRWTGDEQAAEKVLTSSAVLALGQITQCGRRCILSVWQLRFGSVAGERERAWRGVSDGCIEALCPRGKIDELTLAEARARDQVGISSGESPQPRWRRARLASQALP